MPLRTVDPKSLKRSRLRRKPHVRSDVAISKSAQRDSVRNRRNGNRTSNAISIDLRSSTLQKERVSTLRPRRDRKHPKTGKSICLYSKKLEIRSDVVFI